MALFWLTSFSQNFSFSDTFCPPCWATPSSCSAVGGLPRLILAHYRNLRGFVAGVRSRSISKQISCNFAQQGFLTEFYVERSIIRRFQTGMRVIRIYASRKLIQSWTFLGGNFKTWAIGAIPGLQKLTTKLRHCHDVPSTQKASSVVIGNHFKNMHAHSGSSPDVSRCLDSIWYVVSRSLFGPYICYTMRWPTPWQMHGRCKSEKAA